VLLSKARPSPSSCGGALQAGAAAQGRAFTIKLWGGLRAGAAVQGTAFAFKLRGAPQAGAAAQGRAFTIKLWGGLQAGAGQSAGDAARQRAWPAAWRDACLKIAV
jgi:hypothetical protein